ncbi:MAG: cell division protein FtsL [Desulfobacterium sp.]|nr:cell division protein FtsL [Desulfobacterium sp.]
MVWNADRIRKNGVKQEIKKIPGRWLVILLFFLCELFIYTGMRVECTRKGFQISQAEQVRKRSESYRKELIIERERLGSPERIATIARTRLGLYMPKQGQVVYIDQ